MPFTPTAPATLNVEASEPEFTEIPAEAATATTRFAFTAETETSPYAPSERSFCTSATSCTNARRSLRMKFMPAAPATVTLVEADVVFAASEPTPP